MPRRFRVDRSRLQTVCGQAWYAFVLAGIGALAFRNDNPTLLAIIVGIGLIVIGVLLFIVAVQDAG